MLDQKLIDKFLSAHPWPLLFVTVSGAHLYGFESADSDIDLRGCHVTPLREFCRLSPPGETYEVMDKLSPTEMDVVTHDVKKYFALLLNKNGYVLEQVLSPLVVYSTPEFEALKAMVPRLVTRHHRHHFKSFGKNQWLGVVKSGRPTVKGLLYTYRVLLAGIHLMQTGVVESNLVKLNEVFGLSYIGELIDRKKSGREYDELEGQDMGWHESEYQRLTNWLEESSEKSALPDEPSCRAELDELLVGLRLKLV